MNEYVTLLNYSKKINHFFPGKYLEINQTGIHNDAHSLLSANSHNFNPFIFNINSGKKLYIFSYIDHNYRCLGGNIDSNHDEKHIEIYYVSKIDYVEYDDHVEINLVKKINDNIKTKNNKIFPIGGKNISIENVIGNIRHEFCSLPLKDNTDDYYMVSGNRKCFFDIFRTLELNRHAVHIDRMQVFNICKKARTVRDLFYSKKININQIKKFTFVKNFDKYADFILFLSLIGFVDYAPVREKYLKITDEYDLHKDEIINHRNELLNYLDNDKVQNSALNIAKKSNKKIDVNHLFNSEKVELIQKLSEFFDLQRHPGDKDPVKYNRHNSLTLVTFCLIIDAVEKYVVDNR